MCTLKKASGGGGFGDLIFGGFFSVGISEAISAE